MIICIRLKVNCIYKQNNAKHLFKGVLTSSGLSSQTLMTSLAASNFQYAFLSSTDSGLRASVKQEDPKLYKNNINMPYQLHYQYFSNKTKSQNHAIIIVYTIRTPLINLFMTLNTFIKFYKNLFSYCIL